MALVWYDLVEELTSTGGTGAFTLAGATSGHRSFSVVGNGNTCYYMARGSTFTEWEVGLGTWSTGGTLARTSVLASSNSGSAVDFTGTGHTVRLVAPASFLAGLGTGDVTTTTDQTITGRKTFAAVSGGDPTLTTTNAGGSGTIWAGVFWAPNLGSGSDQIVHVIGKTSGQAALFGYRADGKWTIGLWGANDLVTGDGAGNVAIAGAIEAGNFDTDGTLAANSDMKIATQKAVKTYAEGRLQKSENLDDLPNKASARSNLGLGDLATVTPGTGVSSAIAINIGSVGSFIINSGALGTPASGTLTNCSGLPPAGLSAPVTTAKGGLGADNSASTGVPLFAAGVVTMTSTTGSGNIVRDTSPTLATPTLGTPTSGNLKTCAGAAIVGYATAALTVNNSTTYADILGCSVPLKAGTRYRVRVSVTAAGGESLGIKGKLQLNFSSAPTTVRGKSVWHEGTGAALGVPVGATPWIYQVLTTTSTTPTLATCQANIPTDGVWFVDSNLIVTTNLACTLKLQGGQVVAVADDLSFNLNSYIEAVEIPT